MRHDGMKFKRIHVTLEDGDADTLRELHPEMTISNIIRLLVRKHIERMRPENRTIIVEDKLI